MTDGGGEAGAAVRPWNVLVMASLAPLGEFRSVKLAPSLGVRDLGGAAGAPLPRAPGEFLAAVVRDPATPVLITTQRIAWFERSEAVAGADPKRPAFVGYAADFREVGPEVRAVVEGDEQSVVLADDRTVRLPAEPGLADAVAKALRALAGAAWTGEAPPIDPDLARRIEQSIPAMAAADARLRTYGEHAAQFRKDLLAAAPSAPVTRGLIAACVLVMVAMVAAGADPLEPALETLLDWGANDSIRVAVRREFWRLPASVFLHGGLIHLAMNMWCLINVGPLVERFYGHLGFAAVYMAAGVGGSVASMCTPPARIGVGASGAIFGLLGALLAFLLVRRRSIPPTVLASLRSSVLTNVVFIAILGAVVPVISADGPRIDQAAHMGGLATGFLAGLIAAPAWPRRRTAAAFARSAAASIVVAALVAGGTMAAVPWRAKRITPAEEFEHFAYQFEPAYMRFLQTTSGNSEVVALLNARETPADGRALPDLLARLEHEGRTNLVELRKVWTPSPKLAAQVALLDEAQQAQVEGVVAARRFRETGDREWLDGPDGFFARAVEASKLEGERLRLRREFLRANDLPADEEAVGHEDGA